MDKDRAVIGINQLYSFLNHSCRPNVSTSTNGPRMTMKAMHDIKQGEELCVSYLDNEDLELPVKKRHEKLETWFPRCLCVRCKEESRAEARRFRREFSMPAILRPQKRNTSVDELLELESWSSKEFSD
jgi:hypothetical protein